MRLRIIALIAATATSLTLGTSDATAQWGSGFRSCPHGGMCPVGTCSNSGKQRACNVNELQGVELQHEPE